MRHFLSGFDNHTGFAAMRSSFTSHLWHHHSCCTWRYDSPWSTPQHTSEATAQLSTLNSNLVELVEGHLPTMSVGVMRQVVLTQCCSCPAQSRASGKGHSHIARCDLAHLHSGHSSTCHESAGEQGAPFRACSAAWAPAPIGCLPTARPTPPAGHSPRGRSCEAARPRRRCGGAWATGMRPPFQSRCRL